MSEDEQDLDSLDIESEADDDGGQDLGSGMVTEDGKRAHHNALERKRRDNIKDSFTGLKDSIPTIQGDKASRAQILKKASEYIAFMRRKNSTHSNDIEDLKRQNQHLENQVKLLEKAKINGPGQIHFSQLSGELKREDSDPDQPDRKRLKL